MPDILSPNEVQLFGTRYPIVGPVQRTLVDLFAPKVDFGDSANSDEVVLSTWTMRDWSGGLGVDTLVSATKDQTRYSYGTLDSRFPRQLCLAPLVTLRDTLGGSVNEFIDYGGRLYAISNTGVYQWDEPTDVFVSIHTLGSNVSDAHVYKGILHVACEGSDVETYDGTTWGTITGEEARYLATWNDTLYLLHFDGTLNNYTGTGSPASTGAKLDLENGYGTQLITFYDANNLPALYAVTKAGLWAYDSSTGTFVQTSFTYPIHPNIGRACVWQGNLFIPVGATVYRFDAQSVAVVGPDRDEGLPIDLSGPVSELAASHAFYYAAIDGTSIGTSPLDVLQVSWPSHSVFFASGSNSSAVLISDGSTWHVVYVPTMTGTSIGRIYVSNAGNQYRLWFSVGSDVYSLDLPTGMFNPVKNTTPTFAEDGYAITPWFDAFKPQMDKVAIDVQAVARQITADETIQIYVQWDQDDIWNYLGGVTEDGLTNLRIDWDSGGKVFRRARFKITMQRGAVVSKTPVLDSLTLTFQRRPDPIWSYQFTVDLSKTYKGKTPEQLRTLLEVAVEAKTAGLFYYRYGDSTPITDAMVFTTRGSGAEKSGFIPTAGRFSVVLIQVKANG